MPRISVLITGASGDIGLALYRLLHADSRYMLYLHFKNKTSYERVKDHLEVERTSLLFADFTDLVAVKQLATNLPPMDVLINNAGKFEAGSFLETSFEAIEQSLRVNYLAPLVLVHEVARVMQQHGGGKIINLSSGSGNHTGLLPSFGYSAGKNGLNFMTQALAKELGPHHITIITVVLRFVKTKMLASYREYYRDILGKELDISGVDTSLTLYTPHDIATRLYALIQDQTVHSGDSIEVA